MRAVMKDLPSVTFCVPVIYRHFPLACTIINEIHWYSNVAKHSGVETIWRCFKNLLHFVWLRDCKENQNPL